jgi:hypothetical protein
LSSAPDLKYDFLSEKTRKMYLIRTVTAPIFVTEIKTQRTLRYIISILVIILWTLPSASGQQVWPGDINNNGIVNNVDVLYWAVANDARGPARPNASNDWVGQDLPTTVWADTFPGGLNYAYADCNGDGVVNAADRNLLERNFGLVHGDVIPDEFATGEPTSDPTLLLSSDRTTVPPRGTLNADLSLGNETDSISNFYGIAFTVVYDPEILDQRASAFSLDLLPNTWINGRGNDKAIQFIQNDRDLGVAQIAIFRQNREPVTGFGDIGTFKIVMEDIVFLNSTIGNTDIKLVNDELADMMVAPSEVIFSVDTINVTSTRRLIRKSGVKLYPNPVSGQQVTLEMENPDEVIRIVQLFDTNGRLLSHQKMGGLQSKELIDVAELPAGIYTFKIVTDKHLYVQSFYKQP